ncbi:MAG: DUF3365 domain-containing protein [Candidatus Sulfotelmatobacter sp.]
MQTGTSCDPAISKRRCSHATEGAGGAASWASSGRVLYIARPMLIKDAKCLACHDTPDTAPRTLVERYGDANGFGWKLNGILTAQIVSAPMELPMARAKHVSRIFMASLGERFC